MSAYPSGSVKQGYVLVLADRRVVGTTSGRPFASERMAEKRREELGINADVRQIEGETSE